MSAFALLSAYPSFMRFWWGRLAGTTAAQMMMVALGWQMYDLTGSAWDLGLVGLAQFVPALALTVVAGHVVDRHDRRLVLAGCMLLQAGVAFALAAGSAGGFVGRELILGVSLLLGVARAFQMPASQALTPQLVPAEVLARAMAFASAALQAAIVAGPALGGFIYAGGAALTYGVCTALFIAGALAILAMRVERGPVDREPVSLASLFAGFRFIWERKAVLGAISLDLFAVLLGGAVALLPIYAKDILHTGPWGLGLLRAAPAVGAFAMSVLLVRRPIEQRVGHVMFASVAVYGAATVVFGLSTQFWLSFAMLLVSGAADMISVVIRQTMVQLDTPNAMRGRVAAVNSVFIGASNQLGEFRAGATAAAIGAVGSVVAGGLGTLAVVAAWIRLFPSLARRERLTEP